MKFPRLPRRRGILAAAPPVRDWKVTVEWSGPGTEPGSYTASGSTVFAPSVTRSLMVSLILSDAAVSAAARGREAEVTR